ncbi:MAG: LpxI family protein [Candidatus Anammoximicrobium sp.]|nr:LpxI family protein [Candidatus Anammoximicrobium sp.]
MSGAASEKIGLLAGWGRYPLIVAQALRAQGHSVYCLAIKDHADPALREFCDHWQPQGLAKLGAAIRYFHRHGVARATMAGKIHKTLIFRKYHWLKHLPDWRFFWTFYPHWITKTKDRKDDTLLGTIVGAFEQEGIHFAPATDYAPELLVTAGNLTHRAPSAAQWKDIQFGWQLAKELGRVDVGQSVAVKGRAVLAVEAVEGTDECIRRAGHLCPAGGFTVVKVAKPQQDMRFDVPTIGPGTVQTLIEAGAGALAIEAGKTIVLDQDEVVRLADRHKLAIVAVDGDRLGRTIEDLGGQIGSQRG